MDATALERDAVQFARLAVQRDHEGRYSEAVFYYKVGPGPPLWSELLSPESGLGLRPRGGVQVQRERSRLSLSLIRFPALLLLGAASQTAEAHAEAAEWGDWVAACSHRFSSCSPDWQMPTVEPLWGAGVRCG